jgi:hypothetical protein
MAEMLMDNVSESDRCLEVTPIIEFRIIAQSAPDTKSAALVCKLFRYTIPADIISLEGWKQMGESRCQAHPARNGIARR